MSRVNMGDEATHTLAEALLVTGIGEMKPSKNNHFVNITTKKWHWSTTKMPHDDDENVTRRRHERSDLMMG